MYFTGEMVSMRLRARVIFDDAFDRDRVIWQILPHMFDDYVQLRPLKGLAEALARDDTWSPLYDLGQLARNDVKVNAATYVLLV